MRRARAGLAYRVLIFFGTLIIAALMFAVLSPVVDDVLSAQETHTESAAASTGHDWVETIWDYVPLIAVALALIFIIAAAVFERRGVP